MAAWCGAGHRSLQGLLDDQLARELGTAGIHTCMDVLTSNPLDLMAASGRVYSGIHDILVSVGRNVAPKAKTASELLDMQRHNCVGFVPTSLLKLDKVLQGGLYCGTVTEVAGPPGCGKTQFCMTLCTSAVEQGLSAVYIDTEGAFSAGRLLEMASHRWRDSEPALTLNKHLHIYKDLTCQHLLQRLEGIGETLVAAGVKVIVIDSVASVIRREFDTSSAGGASERNAFMFNITSLLKYLAHAHQIAVLVVNQVTTQITPQDSRRSPPAVAGQPEGEAEAARSRVGVALGNAWAHCVNTRLVMEFITRELRKLSVVKSPLAPLISIAYRVEERGVVMDWQATSKLGEVKDCDCESGLRVLADVLEQDGLLWEQ